MDQCDLDRTIYTYARDYLLNFPGITPEILDAQLVPDLDRPDSLREIYKRLLISAQNANMAPSVIGKSINGVESLAPLLDGFTPAKVVERYPDGESLLDTIEQELHPKGQVRRAARSLWPRFCQAILTGARFLSQFEDAAAFYDWVSFFDGDPRARPALPMLLSHEVTGLGFPLACDFVKELGFPNFGKPDVHLKVIFTELGLSSSKADYEVFKAIVRVAEHAATTAYAIDKTFWLIGSGEFYRSNITIGRHRADFIDRARARLAV